MSKHRVYWCPRNGCGRPNGAAPPVVVICKHCGEQGQNFDKYCRKCEHCQSCDRPIKKSVDFFNMKIKEPTDQDLAVLGISRERWEATKARALAAEEEEYGS